MTCFNLEGVDSFGSHFTQPVTIPVNTVNALWLGVQIEADTQPGNYSGYVTLVPMGIPPVKIEVTIEVSNADVARNNGEDDSWRLARMKWLNSVRGRAELPVKPFHNIEYDQTTRTVTCLGRSAVIGDDGLLQKIYSNQLTIFKLPMTFDVYVNGSAVGWKSKVMNVVHSSPASLKWNSTVDSADLSLYVNGEFNFDGYVEYDVTVFPKTSLTVDDIRLQLSLDPGVTEYLMGLGMQGRARNYSQSVHWKWELGMNEIISTALI
jgi:hypothetical protein